MMYCLTEEEYAELKKPIQVMELEKRFDIAISSYIRDAIDVFEKYATLNKLDRKAFVEEMKAIGGKHLAMLTNNSTDATPSASST